MCQSCSLLSVTRLFNSCTCSGSVWGVCQTMYQARANRAGLRGPYTLHAPANSNIRRYKWFGGQVYPTPPAARCSS